MIAIMTVIALMAVAGFATWQYCLVPGLNNKQTINKDSFLLIAVLAAGFAVRVVCSFVYKGHETDINCFTAWGDQLFNEGIASFYKSSGFTDYPPGYMYILYLIGAIKNLFGVSGMGYVFLVKLPANIADIVCCLFIYKLANKKLSNGISALLAGAYAFNPAVITAGALWGQVDSIYATVLMFMVWCISEKRLFTAYLLFAACILIKPHAFIYTPLIAYAIIENYIYPKFDAAGLLKTIGLGLVAIAAMVLAAVPFGFTEVLNQYIQTMSQYQYMTINAFNVWGAIGKNWIGLTKAASFAGYAFLVGIVVYVTYVFFKSKSKSKYYFAAALLAFLTFMLSVKMHERYAFPVMLFLLLAFIYSKGKHNFMLFVTASITQFFNIAWILFIYNQNINKYAFSPVVNVASCVNVALLMYMVYATHRVYVKNTACDLLEAYESADVKAKDKSNAKGKTQKKAASRPVQRAGAVKAKKEFHFKKTAVLPKLARADIIAMAVITLVYASVALYDLGDMKAAETSCLLPQSETVTIDLGGSKDVSKMSFFLGARELNESDRKLKIAFLDDNGSAVYEKELTSGAVFFWSEEDINAKASQLTLYTDSNVLYINEIGLWDNNSELIRPVSYSDDAAKALFDEQDVVPERETFRNSTYFDEIYHARTAYEFIHHLPVYEWTHPPLGKIIISLGIMIFGMCPFGWRIAGTVVGILMVPVIYVFAYKLLKKRWLAIVTCILFTFDFMHFAQTRIATIDVYVTFFIMLMYLFMFKYYTMSFYDSPLKKTFVPLALCGTAMGLAIASKWTGIYAAAGLAVIFFYTLFMRYREYLHALSNPRGETDGISHKHVIDTFQSNAAKTIGWCCIFFIAVPIVIYCLSYIPYMLVPDSQGISVIWQNQEAMLTYHGKTVLSATHPYSSRWYEWIIMKRPIYYYSGSLENGLKEGISAMGNPAVWWAYIPTFFLLVYTAVQKRDKTCIFLLIGYIIQLLPWMGVERVTFIYHYFPTVPFIALSLGYAIKLLHDNAKTDLSRRSVMWGAFAYAAIAVGLFAMFYPALSGQPCAEEYARTWLKWFESWVLVV